jgi:hypothetical protein
VALFAGKAPFALYPFQVPPPASLICVRALGLGRYANNNSISNHDLLFTLSSTIIGRDMHQVFAMLGLPISQAALDSVADLKLPLAPPSYYALGTGKANQLASGQWLDLEGGTMPAYPFP